jgi:hypothetical protein
MNFLQFWEQSIQKWFSSNIQLHSFFGFLIPKLIVVFILFRAKVHELFMSKLLVKTNYHLYQLNTRRQKMEANEKSQQSAK